MHHQNVHYYSISHLMCAFIILLFLAIYTQSQVYRRSPENFLHKHDKSMPKFLAKYKHAKVKFDQDPDPTVILLWWSPAYPLLKKYPKECGSCWLTHDKSMEYSAAGIIFDNTRFKDAVRHNFGGGVPDFVNRNVDTQYWVFWPREAASKGSTKGMDYNLVGAYWDGAFNLTASYRLDSDVVRRWSTTERVLHSVRFDRFTAKYMSYEEHIAQLMKEKNSAKGGHTVWFVSNCDQTRGASARWNYAQEMVSAGLNLTGYGSCFNNELRNGQVPWRRGGLVAKYKFYLAFENSIHCNDYISEKFWRNALRGGAVPVVFGPHLDDVTKVAPPKSFIHAEQFKSPADLVAYLDYLNGNETAYLEYHHWRSAKPPPLSTFKKGSLSSQMTCDLCVEIQKRKAAGWARRTIKSVASWWWLDVHDDKCINTSLVPEWIKQFPPVKMNETYDELRPLHN